MESNGGDLFDWSVSQRHRDVRAVYLVGGSRDACQFRDGSARQLRRDPTARISRRRRLLSVYACGVTEKVWSGVEEAAEEREGGPCCGYPPPSSRRVGPPPSSLSRRSLSCPLLSYPSSPSTSVCGSAASSSILSSLGPASAGVSMDVERGGSAGEREAEHGGGREEEEVRRSRNI